MVEIPSIVAPIDNMVDVSVLSSEIAALCIWDPVSLAATEEPLVSKINGVVSDDVLRARITGNQGDENTFP